jgi:hypothetical protein
MQMTELSKSRFYKLTLSVREEGGLFFATSEDKPDVFIAVKTREDLRGAIDTCLKDVFAQQGNRINVYMNCQLSGASVDAVVEIA